MTVSLDLRIHDYLFSEFEASQAMSTALPLLQPATVGDGTFSNSRIADHVKLKHDSTHIFAKTASLLIGKTIECAETPEIVRYKAPNGGYAPHFDVGQIGDNPRIGTVVFFLKTPMSGGQLVFPNIGQMIEPVAHRTAWWRNVSFQRNSWVRINDSLHGSGVVTAGEKWICTVWVHDSPLTEEFSNGAAL